MQDCWSNTLVISPAVVPTESPAFPMKKQGNHRWFQSREIWDASTMRTPLCLSVVLLSAGCFNPDPVEGEALETESDGQDETSGGQTSQNPSATDTNDSDPSTTDSDTDGDTDEPDPTEGNDPVCGDGEVEGDEVCDDGVNDGGYGGCAADCSAEGPFCGDGEVTDDEACDDGVNDGSYGGCNDDCTVAAFCGDGSIDGDNELCDDGEANENGSGCNIDCTTSGTLLFESMQTGLMFCDGAFGSAAEFDSEGNAFIAATGYCGQDSQLLQEFSPQLEVVQTFDVLLPETPINETTMVGDKWVMSASGCNYAIEDGTLTEACGDNRLTGRSSLASIGDPGFLALDFGNRLGLYGPMAPNMGDAPLWEVEPQKSGFFEFDWYRAAPGPSDSVLVAGRREDNNGTEVGLLLQYTAAGNEADSNTYAAVPSFNEIATGPDGAPLLYTRFPFGDPGYPNGILTQMNVAFGVSWTLQLPNPGNIRMAIDSTGAPVLLLEDGNGNGAYELRKLDPADGSTVWSVGLPEAGYDSRLSIAPDDYIWVTAGGYGNEGGQLWVGRVSP
jgi:hypothetical protein